MHAEQTLPLGYTLELITFYRAKGSLHAYDFFKVNGSFVYHTKAEIMSTQTGYIEPT